MTNKPMLVINHIEPVGLIAESGSELAKAFSNTYFNQAANEIADQDEIEALHFMGSQADIFFLAAEGYQGDLLLSMSHKAGSTSIQVDNSNADAIDRMLSMFITKYDRFGVVQSLKEVS